MPYVTTDLGKWYYEAQGAARSPFDPAVVLLHPLFFDSRMWEPCVGPLAARGRVLAFDAPGHGRSQAPPPFTLEQNAEALEQALGGLGVRRAIFVGSSWGGYLAMHMALDHASMIAGMVLIGAGADCETAYRRIKYRLFIAFMRRFGLPQWLVDAQLAKLLFARPTPELRRALVQRGDVQPRDGLIRSALAVVTHRPSLVDRLGEISVPTLLIFGREDRSVTAAAIRHLREGIRDSRTVFIDGAGHLTPIDAPSEVSRHLVSFVAGLLDHASAAP